TTAPTAAVAAAMAAVASAAEAATIGFSSAAARAVRLADAVLQVLAVRQELIRLDRRMAAELAAIDGALMGSAQASGGAAAGHAAPARLPALKLRHQQHHHQQQQQQQQQRHRQWVRASVYDAYELRASLAELLREAAGVPVGLLLLRGWRPLSGGALAGMPAR
ncbi:hypothetical protein Agub_g5786, partial [Astrephomene gubernaculifera]